MFICLFKKSHRLLLILVFLTILFACTSPDSTQQPGGFPPATVTVAYPLERTVVEWDEYTGRLEPIDFVEVRSRVSGYLKEIKFKEGDIVKKDDLLFVIDQRPYQAALKQAQAELARTQATLSLAQSRLDRGDELLAKKVLSKEDYDARLNEQRTALAEVAAAKARVEAASLDLEFTKVTAPVTGRISSYYVSEGNLVNGGSAQSTLLTTIVSLDPIYCVFEASERDYLKYARLAKAGKRESSREVKNPVFLQLADEKEYLHQGYMDFVDNRLDPNTATIRGRALFENKDYLLTPGLFAKVRILGSGQYQAIQIPEKAIGIDQAEKFVLVVNQENTVEYRPIKVGAFVDGLRVIEEGLTSKDRIIVKGLIKARPGSQVNIEMTTITAKEPFISAQQLSQMNIK